MSEEEAGEIYEDLKESLPNSVPNLGSIETVYHYCSTATFLTILSNGTLRLSDLSKMNDSKEMSWGLEKLESVLESNEAIVGKDFVEELESRISFARSSTRFLICCLSTKGDLLSQWRAYGDNGSGFSIGFKARDAEKINNKLGPVIYDPAIQCEHLKQILLSGCAIWRRCVKSDRRKLALDIALRLLTASCFMKNPAFSEESEVRIVQGFIYADRKTGFKLITPKIANKSKTAVEFSSRNGWIVPYLDLSFSDQKKIVGEVYAGPRNLNNDTDVKAALSQYGHGSAQIIRSAASYRSL